MCSGHGSCSTRYGVCNCFSGYYGSDCSQRSCHRSTAWVDFASADDIAHADAECSNKGICDRQSGICLCQQGFEGVACERKSCPNSCNNKGRCVSSRFLANMQEPGHIIKDEGCTSSEVCVNGDCSERDYSVCKNTFEYSIPWEADMMYGCVCDETYSGYDCSIRSCQSGDDPLSIGQLNEVQHLECQADGGTFTLSYNGETTSPISATSNLVNFETMVSELESLRKSGDNPKINVSWSSGVDEVCSDSGNDIQITFLQNFGDLPLLIPDGTSLTLTSGSPLITSQKLITGTKENEECSNRGICDVSHGTCTCLSNWMTSDGYNGPGTRGDCGYDAGISTTSCPGEFIPCLGLGTCSGSPSYRCSCEEGRFGPDCSLLHCPSGKSWFSKPSMDNEAHSLKECSDMGVCDTTTGQCQCAFGFSGSACEYMDCPGNPPCNGNGECYSMEHLALLSKSSLGNPTPFIYGVDPNDLLTWDHDQIFGCSCSDGFEGYDCSLKSCPKGDDPLTPHQVNEEQIFSCQDSDSNGSFALKFRGEYTSTLSATDSIEELESALNAISTIEKAVVGYVDPDTFIGATGLAIDALYLCRPTSQQIFITFLAPSDDVPLIEVFSVVDIDGPLSFIEEVKGTKEFIECSGRGLCDHKKGVCNCVTGYGSSDNLGNPGSRGDCGYQMPVIVEEDDDEVSA